MREVEVGGRKVLVHIPHDVGLVLIHLAFPGDVPLDVPCGQVLLPVANWNDDLSPWTAPNPFGGESFGGLAPQTLSFITTSLLPELTKVAGHARFGIGGYSLGGLFALWAATQCGSFDYVMAASPSVWYPGWMEYEREHTPMAGHVYLSLGLREERSRNPLIRTVGENIRTLEQRLCQRGVDTVLQWNQGGHHADERERCAVGYRWLLDRFSPSP